MLNEEPVVALGLFAVGAPPHQHPPAAEPLPGENEFKVPATQHLLGRLRALRSPEAAVPQLHGPASVLALGNGAFKIPVVEWMILHLDCEATHFRIERRAPGDSPGF